MLNPYSGLTARELAIIKLVNEGKTDREVAQTMGMSEQTLKKYLYAIYRKMYPHPKDLKKNN